jgi:hypothetical protein
VEKGAFSPVSPYPGKMLPEVVVEAPASSKIEYDKIDYLNPFDYKYVVTKGLKKANAFLGGNIERGGYDRESYSDLINRLEQTPGTFQYWIKNGPKIPTINHPILSPINFGIHTLNAAKDVDANRKAAALGDVVLDPINRVPVGRMAKFGLHGVANFVQTLPRGAKAAQRLMNLGSAAPYVDLAGDVAESADSYIEYPNKPRFEPKKMTPQQKEFLQKLSEYNFGVK